MSLVALYYPTICPGMLEALLCFIAPAAYYHLPHAIHREEQRSIIYRCAGCTCMQDS